jgi:predicted nucleotidyltransferase
MKALPAIVEQLFLSEIGKFECVARARVVFAALQGSRAWGYAHSASDYDIHFVYVNESPELNTPLVKVLDTISFSVDNRNYTGYTLSFFLEKLVRRASNFFEMLTPQYRIYDGGNISFNEHQQRLLNRLEVERYRTSSAGQALQYLKEARKARRSNVVKALIGSSYQLFKGVIVQELPYIGLQNFNITFLVTGCCALLDRPSTVLSPAQTNLLMQWLRELIYFANFSNMERFYEEWNKRNDDLEVIAAALDALISTQPVSTPIQSPTPEPVAKYLAAAIRQDDTTVRRDLVEANFNLSVRKELAEIYTQILNSDYVEKTKEWT